MSNDYYEFDPCSLDKMDIEEELTLDTWQPRRKEPTIIQSEWRKQQIGTNFNQHPGIDDLQKIEKYLKKKTPDSKIMETFGITCETLSAIKQNRYCPADGIAFDDFTKVFNAFRNMESREQKLRRGLEYISKQLFKTKKQLKEYKEYCKNKKGQPTDSEEQNGQGVNEELNEELNEDNE